MDPTESERHPELTQHALRYDLGPEGMPVFSDPIEVNEEWYILKIHFRRHPHTLGFEDAQELVRRDLERAAMEDTLTTKYDSLSRAYNLEVDYEPLHQGLPEES
jgi:hypothetical protein